VLFTLLNTVSFYGLLMVRQGKEDLNQNVILTMHTGLAPEHRFPAAPIDCIECYRSVIEDYGVDPKKIIMGILRS
jgi:alpha/beta hydrolase fold